jgi:uncharacterized protein (DUF302 family)
VYSREEIAKEATVNPSRTNGIIQIVSRHSVNQTLANLQDLLDQKGIRIFAIVDHSGEAAKVGLSMQPTKLVIFGSPKAGTPVMIAAPSTAIDLPLKILISEGKDGKVLVSYNDNEWLTERHEIPSGLSENLAAVKTLAEDAAQ